MDLQASVKKGLLSGVRVLWELAKVIIPAVVVIHLLEKTGLMVRLSDALGPLMGLFGLPGESALVLVSANFVSTYAGIATIVALGMPMKQTTIISALIMINHAAIQETALVAKVGARSLWMLLARTVAMVVVGLALNWLM